MGVEVFKEAIRVNEKTKKKIADNVTVMQNDFTKAQHSQKRIFSEGKESPYEKIVADLFLRRCLDCALPVENSRKLAGNP